MGILVENPSRNVFVLDSLARVSPAQVALAVARGFAAFGRYVNLSEGQDGPYCLLAPELAAILDAGCGAFVIQEGRESGWSEPTGRADGLAAARNLLALGLPVSTPLVCDHEGSIPSAAASIDYLQAWWSSATSEGCSALKLYPGSGCPLDASSLFHDLSFRGYWRAPGDRPNVAVRNYQAFQMWPFDQEALGPQGGQFDVSAVPLRDLLGDSWGWARAA